MVEKTESECSEMEDESESEQEEQQEEMELGESSKTSTDEAPKKKKRGIIYISTIPKFMNVTILREMLDQYAKVGRIFLQPEKVSGNLSH